MFRRVISQTVAVRARTFATTPVARAGAFSAFMKQVYKNKAQKAVLSKLPIAQKGKQMAKWYKALSAAELKQLVAAGKKMKMVRKSKKAKKTGPKRKPSAYNKFVKAKMATPAIKALPQLKRMAAVAKLWKKAK